MSINTVVVIVKTKRSVGHIGFLCNACTFTGACSALVNAQSMMVSLPNEFIYPLRSCDGDFAGLARPAGLTGLAGLASSASVLQYEPKTGDSQHSSFQQNLSPS